MFLCCNLLVESIPLFSTRILLWCLTKESLAFNPVCVDYALLSWTGNIHCLPLIKCCCYSAYTWSWCSVICSKVYWRQQFHEFQLMAPRGLLMKDVWALQFIYRWILMLSKQIPRQLLAIWPHSNLGNVIFLPEILLQALIGAGVLMIAFW